MATGLFQGPKTVVSNSGILAPAKFSSCFRAIRTLSSLLQLVHRVDHCLLVDQAITLLEFGAMNQSRGFPLYSYFFVSIFIQLSFCPTIFFFPNFHFYEFLKLFIPRFQFDVKIKKISQIFNFVPAALCLLRFFFVLQ